MVTVISDEVRERVRAQVEAERDELQAKLDEMSALYDELVVEADKASDAYWSRAKKRGYDTPDDDEASKLYRAHAAAAERFIGVERSVAALRSKIAKLDDVEIDRRARVATERKTTTTTNGGTKMSKTTEAPKRVPVPQNVIDRIVKAVQTKSQQEVADELNKDGLTTASGKPWTPQNIWHAVKGATGKGVPRKSRKLKDRAPAPVARVEKKQRATTTAAKQNGKATTKPKATTAKAAPKKVAAVKATARTNGKRTSAPISKSSQASGTSRGGSGSRKKQTQTRGGSKRR